MFSPTTRVQLNLQLLLSFQGQPIDQQALQSVLLTVEEVNLMNPPTLQLTETAGEGGAMITEATVTSASS